MYSSNMKIFPVKCGGMPSYLTILDVGKVIALGLEIIL
jgi:hypothetical protein